jgi:hypothetical protein
LLSRNRLGRRTRLRKVLGIEGHEQRIGILHEASDTLTDRSPLQRSGDRDRPLRLNELDLDRERALEFILRLVLAQLGPGGRARYSQPIGTDIDNRWIERFHGHRHDGKNRLRYERETVDPAT